MLWAVGAFAQGEDRGGTRRGTQRMSLDQSAAVAVVYFEDVHTRTIIFVLKNRAVLFFVVSCFSCTKAPLYEGSCTCTKVHV